jgi:hypothetical protein
MTYRCKYCASGEHLVQTAVRKFTVWFTCRQCLRLWGGGVDQSFNRSCYSQYPPRA